MSISIPPHDNWNATFVANTHPADWQNPTPKGRYNLLVIGGGSAGLVAAVGAAGLGAKVALVEKHLLGGDCLYAGCVPSKTLIRAARAVGDLRHSADANLGIVLNGDLTVDFAAVMERVRRVRAEISHHDSAERFRKLGIDVYLGAGAFSGPDRFTVDGRTIHFAKAVIATGARAAHVPIPGLEPGSYLTNEGIFELTALPPRLAVIGAGPIGAEMAQAFARLGSRVALFDIMPTIAGVPDPAAQALLREAFARDGIDLHLESQITRVETRDGTRVLHVSQGTRHSEVTADVVLLAAGRQPNVEGLNLEAAGIAWTRKGVTVNDNLRTANPRIFAAGDVAIPHQFTHMADASARIVLQNALFFGRKRYSDLIAPWAVYTDPEVAHVGRFPHEAEAAGIGTATYTTAVADTDRGRADGESGFVKVYTRRGSDRIIGATIVARHAGELISEITTAMQAGAGLGVLARTIHPYPTQAEAIRKTADAYNRTRLTPAVARLFKLILRFK